MSEFEAALHGERYHVIIAGLAHRESGRQDYYLWVDGVTELVS